MKNIRDVSTDSHYMYKKLIQMQKKMLQEQSLSVVTVTLAGLDLLIENNTVTIGKQYFVSDKNWLLLGVSDSTLTEVRPILLTNGEALPEGITPDVLYIDTGLIVDDIVAGVSISVPEGYNYFSMENKIEEGNTVTGIEFDSSTKLLSATDNTSEGFRAILKFERSKLVIPIVPPQLLPNSFINNDQIVTIGFNNLMKVSTLIANNFTLLVNSQEFPIDSVTTGIDDSIVSIVPDFDTETPAFKSTDVITLEIAPETLENTFGGKYAGGTVSILNLISPEIASLSVLSSYIPFNENFVFSGSITGLKNTASVKIVYGYNGYTNEQALPAITSEDLSENIISRTFTMRRSKPGNFWFKFVVTEGSNIYEAEDVLTVYPGTKNELVGNYASPVLVGTTYYIDPTASVNGNGLSESTPMNVLPTLGNSNTYRIKSGTQINYIGYSNRVGTVGTCKITTYGGDEMAELNWIVTGSSSTRFIDATGGRLILDNIHVSSTDIFGIGIYLANSGNSHIVNCEVKGFSTGIYSESHVFSPYSLQWSGLVVAQSTLHGQGLDTFNLRNVTNVELAYVYTYDTNMYYWYNHPANISEAVSPGDSVQINSACRNPADPTGALIPQVSYIHHCTFDRSSTGNKMCIIIDCATAQFNITNNHFIGQRSFPNSVNGVYLSMGTQTAASGNIVAFNTFENCGAANVAYFNGNFIYNKVINCALGVVVNQNRTQNVYNNIFHNIPGYAVNKLTGASADVRNNVFIDCPYTVQFLSGGTNINSHNHFDNSTVTGTNATTGDSLFVDKAGRDYSLASNASPLFESGADLGLLLDFNGDDVEAPVSKGVYQTTF